MTHQPTFDRPSPDVPLSVIILSDHGWVNGGQAKVAIDSALWLRQRGIDVCFVAGSGPLDERLTAAGIDCRLVGEHDILSDPSRLHAAASGIWNRHAADIVATAIASRDPAATVVHVHGWAKALSPSIGPVVTRARAAHVFTLHEYFLACPNGGFFDYPAGRVCTRRALGADCLTTQCDSRGAAYKAWRVARQVVLKSAGRMPRDVREVIYLAPEQRTVMAPYFSAETNWHHLPNAVEVRPKTRIPAERNDVFLYVGRLSPEKGAVVAAAAAREAGVRIVFCGDGEEAAAVRRANPDAVITGWLDQQELGGWMAQARCLVFPSLWYECYPLVVADALRAGLPVLVSDSSVARSSIAHGVDGLHVPSGDVGAWASAMRRFADDDGFQAFGEAAFAAGKRLLDEDQYSRRLIGIYERVRTRRNAALAPIAEAAA